MVFSLYRKLQAKIPPGDVIPWTVGTAVASRRVATGSVRDHYIVACPKSTFGSNTYAGTQRSSVGSGSPYRVATCGNSELAEPVRGLMVRKIEITDSIVIEIEVQVRVWQEFDPCLK